MASGDGRGSPIRVRRVYENPRRDDGMRVLVDRLWPRGVSGHRARIDRRVPELAPSPDLRRWFGHDPERFQEFRDRYREELDDRTEAMETLLDEAGSRRLTLVFAARDAEHNHAVVLAEVLGELSGRGVAS